METTNNSPNIYIFMIHASIIYGYNDLEIIKLILYLVALTHLYNWAHQVYIYFDTFDNL